MTGLRYWAYDHIFRAARKILKGKIELVPWKELSKYAKDKILSETQVGC